VAPIFSKSGFQVLLPFSHFNLLSQSWLTVDFEQDRDWLTKKEKYDRRVFPCLGLGEWLS
jgi:hypothetical protein